MLSCQNLCHGHFQHPALGASPVCNSLWGSPATSPLCMGIWTESEGPSALQDFIWEHGIPSVLHNNNSQMQTSTAWNDILHKYSIKAEHMEPCSSNSKNPSVTLTMRLVFPSTGECSGRFVSHCREQRRCSHLLDPQWQQSTSCQLSGPIRSPKHPMHALKLDCQNGNTKWQDTTPTQNWPTTQIWDIPYIQQRRHWLEGLHLRTTTHGLLM